MPLWYYDKKDLRNTPSLRDGIEPEVEARYRKEGARFIIDCGTKLGLRYDSCATGVVFFHRFYMFHSFKEFHRYVTAVCCLFLAGKTEETPKKCKDIIKTTRSMLNDAQFMVFGDDPKEEVMTMERILLQTIKFDLMVEHPYAFLLKFAKMIKSKSESADKGKVQKLVQMAWTFINDSLCTMLCLQWEPEVVAVSLMYLSSRLTKTDIADWQGKPAGFKGKWWEYLVEDINLELLEDVCHQVLDLYSSAPKKRDDTPPPPPPKVPHPSSMTSSGSQSSSKRPRSPTPGELHRSHSQPSIGPPQSKLSRDDKRPPSPPSMTKDRDRSHKKISQSSSVGGSAKSSWSSSHPLPGPPPPSAVPAPPSSVPLPPPPASTTATTAYSQNNPYMPSQMFTSSFMTQEGSQSIQSLVGGRPAVTATSTYPPAPPYTQPPPTHTTQTPAASTSYTTQHTYQHTYQQAYQQQGYSQTQTQTSYTQPQGYTQPYSYPSGQYPASGTTYPQQQSSTYNQTYPRQQYPPAPQQYSQQYPGYSAQNYQNFAPTQSYQAPQTAQQGPPQPATAKPHTGSNPGSGLGIRITTRQ